MFITVYYQCYRCTSDQCERMVSEDECLSCQEIDAVQKGTCFARTEDRSEDDVFKCMTLQSGFEPACLNKWTLQTVWCQFKDSTVTSMKDLPLEISHIAYRQLFRLVRMYGSACGKGTYLCEEFSTCYESYKEFFSCSRYRALHWLLT